MGKPYTTSYKESQGGKVLVPTRYRDRSIVTAKREKSQTPKVLTAILTLPNLT